MKKTILLLLALPVILTGCSSSKNAGTTTAPVVSQSGQEISNIEPTLKQQGFVRQQITDPVLYSYLQSTQKSGTSSGAVTNADIQAKIGKSAKFPNSSKYNIAGIAQIIAIDKIKIKSFSYNGACGIITINPTIQNNLTKPLAPIQRIQTPVSNVDLDATIPTNLSLTQFDSLSIFCSNKPEEPISTAAF